MRIINEFMKQVITQAYMTMFRILNRFFFVNLSFVDLFTCSTNVQ